jgi:hypothetical protein
MGNSRNVCKFEGDLIMEVGQNINTSLFANLAVQKRAHLKARYPAIDVLKALHPELN